jgi:hypothetical protein
MFSAPKVLQQHIPHYHLASHRKTRCRQGMRTPAHYLWTEESILADGQNVFELLERTALVG